MVLILLDLANAAVPAELPALLGARPELGPLGLRLDAVAMTPRPALGALHAERVARHVFSAISALITTVLIDETLLGMY